MEAVDRVLQDLEVDLALTEGQVFRWYGKEAVGSLFVPARGQVRQVVMPLRKGGDMVEVRFVVHPRVFKASGPTLRHLAGLAEMRRIVGARPEEWHLGDFSSPHRPDAMWGHVAVEYDAGFYPVGVLREKLGGLEGYPVQVWGVPSESRRALVERIAREMAIQNLQQVLVAPWF